MPPTYCRIENPTRLRVRRVNEADAITYVTKTAAETGKPHLRAAHGGSVANAYNYPASTEGCVAVGFPDGSYWCYVTRLPANKVTLSGVFAAATGIRGAFDRRFSKHKRQFAVAMAIDSAYRELNGLPPLPTPTPTQPSEEDCEE
jgi:hypothetical protein